MMRWMRALMVAMTLAVAPAIASAAEQAAPFTLRDLDGNTVSLADFKGQVVLISFWATWCGPCKVEMKHLAKLDEAWKDKGFKLLSISSDDARTKSQVKPYIMRNQYKFTVLYDTDSSVTAAFNPTKTLPWTVIVDKSGNVAKVFSGYQPGEEKEVAEFVHGLLGADVPMVEFSEGPVPAP